jgi:chorismate mutase
MSEPSKTKPNPQAATSLESLRTDIDRIDASIHALLMERGEIIGELIKVKRTQESGAAFRPAREALMMRRLVERHRGILPLDTVESIWRVIIATFTYVQAPYAVHADFSAGDSLVRDSARFHFGFTVPLSPHLGAAAVVAAVAQSKGDLGLVPASNVAGGGAWWAALEDEKAPKIIARLPFVERMDHPASLPLFVVSRPIVPDAAAIEVQTWSVRVAGWSAAAARAISPLGEVIAVPDKGFDGAALLLSLPPGRTLEEASSALVAAGATVRATALVGGHATRYTI